MRYYYLLVLSIFIFACNNENNRLLEPVIARGIDSLLSKNQFNGIILVTKEDQTVYQKAIGFANITTKVPLKINDQFFIGSISKQITAVLILKEVEKGRISLDDKISDYLQQINQPWAKEITIHHLLTHTHGITDINKPLAFEKGKYISSRK